MALRICNVRCAKATSYARPRIELAATSLIRNRFGTVSWLFFLLYGVRPRLIWRRERCWRDGSRAG